MKKKIQMYRCSGCDKLSKLERLSLTGCKTTCPHSVPHAEDDTKWADGLVSKCLLKLPDCMPCLCKIIRKK